MKTKVKIQKNGENSLKEEILNNSNEKLLKLYIIAGCVKETGYDVIEEALIDLKAKGEIVIEKRQNDKL